MVMLAMHVAGDGVIDDAWHGDDECARRRMSLVLWWRRTSRIILRVQSLCASAVTSANVVAAGVSAPVMAYMHRVSM